MCNFLVIKSSHKTLQYININVFNSENTKSIIFIYLIAEFRMMTLLVLFFNGSVSLLKANRKI